VTPVDALRRIAYLLEAEGAESYKVRAFRQAAKTVEAIAPDDLLRLHGQRRLQTLDGVGKSTAGVIGEALAGSVPTYLLVLEERVAHVPSGPVGDLLRSLRGDCHSHSDWSDGGSSIEEMASTAKGLGRSYQALTDHSPRLTVAHGVNAEDLRRQIKVVSQLNENLAPFRLLTGIEVDILDDGSLDQDEGLLAQLDVVVASVHSKLRMESSQMTKRMLAAVSNPNVDILGHCTGRIVVGRRRAESTFDHEAVFAACAATDTAVEINSRPDRRDPPENLLRAAASAGCRFSIDSDAHAPGQLSWLTLGCEQAVQAEIPARSIVNTMDLDDFLAWTSSHN
jgi:putative hydrolase